MFRSYLLKALSGGGKIVSMCCSTGEVLCDFELIIISGIVCLAPVTDYYFYRQAAYDKILLEIRTVAYRSRNMVIHIFILESHVWF